MGNRYKRMAKEVMTDKEWASKNNYLQMKLRESREEAQELKEQLKSRNKAAHDSSTIAKPEAVSPIGEENPPCRLQDYEPGKDMGMGWYTKRIFGLVDEVNRLTCLLDTHHIPHKNTRT